VTSMNIKIMDLLDMKPCSLVGRYTEVPKEPNFQRTDVQGSEGIAPPALHCQVVLVPWREPPVLTGLEVGRPPRAGLDVMEKSFLLSLPLGRPVV
jgi:hypothetical protein